MVERDRRAVLTGEDRKVEDIEEYRKALTEHRTEAIASKLKQEEEILLVFSSNGWLSVTMSKREMSISQPVKGIEKC